jgi:hypothetical protein
LHFTFFTFGSLSSRVMNEVEVSFSPENLLYLVKSTYIRTVPVVGFELTHLQIPIDIRRSSLYQEAIDCLS